MSDGVVSIRSEGQPIAELGPGEALGALCLVSAGLRMCDAVAATPSSLLCLSRESYARLRLDQPALALQPGSARAYQMLGDIYAGAEQDDQAILHYRKALEIEPDNALFRNNLEAMRKAPLAPLAPQ
mgnify:CR=1 FL=1